MSTTPSTMTAASEVRANSRQNLLCLATFAATLFLSALLLFAVQPMFAKMVLPKLGGSPGVWSVAMVFFQSALLAGYAYAHLLTKKLSPRHGALIHISVMVAVLVSALPISIAGGFGRPPSEGQALWLLGLFAASIGAPFFAVAANAPLLQAWFARSGHPHRDDPYFLYGASNVGSLLALVSYPFLVEPLTTLAEQARLWTWGFALLIGAVALSAAFVVRRREPIGVAASVVASGEQIGWSRRAAWAAFAFVPSALLVAVTAHISTDVAAAPLFWVVPLALFLVTFIITFQRKPILSHALMVRLQPIMIGLPAISSLDGLGFSWPIAIALHLAGFFSIAMVCHGELVRRRPAAAQLTEFYLWMSLGGVLGGLFAGLLAPAVFSTVIEYPLLIVAGLLCRPGLWDAPDRKRQLRAAALILGITVLLVVPGLGFGWMPPEETAFAYKWGLAGLAGVIMLQGGKPARLVALVVLAMAISGTYSVSIRPLETVRSFFGVHKIVETPDRQFHLLMHGTTAHGAVRVRSPDGKPVEGPPKPTTYYHAEGAIAQPILAARQARGGKLASVAIVGVGTGSLACFKQAGETWSFYDIDPDVVAIAGHPAKFRFISTCAPDAAFVIGDARLTVADARDRGFDVIVVDAFTSDAIPVHLLTREAIALYAQKLADNGLIVMHVSNRNMELASVVAAAGAAEGLVAWTRDRFGGDRPNLEFDPHVVVLARRVENLGSLPTTADWKPLRRDSATSAWTDDHADIIGAIWRRFRP
jgi:hypothetical protein